MTESLGSEEIVFRPQYKRKLWWSIIVLAIMVVIGIPLTWNSGDVWVQLSFFFLALIVLAAPFAILKEIRFGDGITLKRWLLPDTTYAYADVRDVGITGFRLRRYNVGWGQMKNADELIEIVDGLIERGVIPADQLEGKQAEREVSALVASVYGGITGLVVSVVLVLFGIYPASIPPSMFGVAVIVVCISAVYVVHRRRADTA